ncbi:MAG: RNA polymerase sigma factor, partial [Flavitalea sp.]
INSSIEHYRKKQAKLTTVSDKEENTIENSDISALDSLAERDIINLIQDLSPGYRTVFNLYVVEGYSHKEIGELLGISEGTSKSQLARAKSILQKKVTQYLSDTQKSYNRKNNG